MCIRDRYTNVHSQNNYQANLSNRSYGFKELAVLYFPNIAPASASIRLKPVSYTHLNQLNDLDRIAFKYIKNDY